MIRNIIFDWSGTLVDDLPAVWQATNYVMRQAGNAELSLDQFRAEFCLPFAQFYERYTAHIPMSQLEDWFHSHFRQVQDSVIELPYAREFLLFCRQTGLRTFLLSTLHREHFAEQSAKNGFHNFLERAYIEVWDKRKKILEVLKENKLDPRETLFIGDMQHDIETAKQGGIFSCAVLTGYNRLEQLRVAEPDVIVEHLGELRQMLEEQSFDLKPKLAQAKAKEQRQPILTVGALIFNETGELLMIRTHKWSDLWGIPGGKVKYGESSHAALRREIKEETNLQVENIQFVLVQDCIKSTEFYREAHFVLLNYTCRCVGKPFVTLNNEAQEFRWVSFHGALSLPLNQPTRNLLSAVMQQSAGGESRSSPPQKPRLKRLDAMAQSPARRKYGQDHH